MSRYYEMNVTIDGFALTRKQRIVDACREEWEFEPDSFETYVEVPGMPPTRLTTFGRSSLCGGESESEFADRLSAAVWRANGGFCEVTVAATYLEELPYESHVRDEDDYKAWMRKAKRKRGGRS